MTPSATVVRVTAFLAVFVGSCSNGAFAQTCSEIPCVEEWANLTNDIARRFDLMAIASDSAGNTFVSGVGRSPVGGLTTRLLQKFTREGYTITNPATDTSLPWWVEDSPGSVWSH